MSPEQPATDSAAGPKHATELLHSPKRFRVLSRIAGLLCFYPDRTDRVLLEGESLRSTS
jgi:hypothetical protein